jgi:SNF2 family DNA or RNA helicase
MNEEFKEILYSLIARDPGRYTFRGRSIDYDKAITHGALGETGENYFFFIYKDAFEKPPAYGAVYFLYRPFNIKRPFETGFKCDFRLREHVGFYTKAAVYFLKKNYHDTMLTSASKELETLYQELKDLAVAHEQEVQVKQEYFRTYDFNVLAYGVRAEEVPLPPADTDREPLPEILRHLERLKKTREQEPEKEKPASRARLALSLKVPGLMGKNFLFQPLILPVKRNGTYGILKPAVPSQMKKYRFLDTFPPKLTEFLGHLQQLNMNKKGDAVRAGMVSRFYFPELARILLDMPDELTYCHFADYGSHHFPLKKLEFDVLEICFAPVRNGEGLNIVPMVSAPNGPLVEAGSGYKVLVIDENHVYLFISVSDEEYYLALPAKPEAVNRCLLFLKEIRTISLHEFPLVCKELQKIASDSLIIRTEPIPLFRLDFKPTPILNILEKDRLKKRPERIEVEFDYKSGPNSFLIENPHIRQTQYDRNQEFENMCLFLLKNDPLLEMQYGQDIHGGINECYFTFTRGDDLDWLMENSARYLKDGFRIYSASRKQFIGKSDSILRIDVDSGIHWLEFKPLLQNAATGETFEIEYIDYYNSTITDKNGTLHLVREEDKKKLLDLTKYAQHVGSIFRVPSKNYFLINALYDQRMESLPQLKETLFSARNLENFKKIPQYRISPNFNGTLRNYQEAGVRWLLFLHDYHLSGCLADDMGLGKTVQTLALLQTLKDENRLSTSLLIVPVSAVPNWEAEIARFTPGLSVYRNLGPNRKEGNSHWRDYDLVITSYATLRNDIKVFTDFRFDYIIPDESQTIKNFASQTTKAVKILEAEQRLALSGTPMENTSMELWSLFDFLMPGYLSNPRWFKEEWATPVEKYKNTRKTELLKQMIYPFILRRKKDEVEKDLPEKIEIVETLNMEDEQLKLYASTAQYYSEIIADTIDEKGLEKSSFKILEGMLRLRQICLFPRLWKEEYQAVPSVKYDHFTGMLEDILAEGHKVLVFSQFVNVLSIIKEYFEEQQIGYAYIDGSVPVNRRERMIRDFQENRSTPVFLLSLKAGGVALNLTAADYVIIFDPWWNPAVEAQAIDRSHRIGQTKKVFVYRMVVKDTIEEKMLALQEQKRELVEKLITSEAKGFKDLTRDDVLNLFQYSASGGQEPFYKKVPGPPKIF